jgi:hypothetical protein
VVESYRNWGRHGKAQIDPPYESDLLIAHRRAGDILRGPMHSFSTTLESVDAPRPSADEFVTDRGRWSYLVALLFLVLYYIRPQDWVPGMAGANIIRPVIVIWAIGMTVEGLSSPLRGFFRTPHDWVMLIFYGYVVCNAPDQLGTGMGMFSLVVFYYLTTQALASWTKLLTYLRIWTWLLIIIALFGVLQTIGIDITGGKEITDYGRGRLALGTWTCNNANALGHTVVAALPLSYIMLFWRASPFSRLVLFPSAVALIFTCAWHTQSKGSFLVGAVLSVLVFIVGRPRWVQMIVLAATMTAGVGALSFMPRMESMGSLQSEEGVMGRIMAWDNAHRTMDRNTTGAGWRQFEAWITFVDQSGRLITESKSTHSSYVQIGADLGRPGIYLWLLVLFCTFRSVAFFKSEDDTQERCRRAVLLILTAYIASSWMINREYHTEYYLIAAVGAAFHRLTVSAALRAASNGGGSQDAEASASLPWAPAGYEQLPWLNPASAAARKLWTRLDFIDLAAAGVGTWVVLYVWESVKANV